MDYYLRNAQYFYQGQFTKGDILIRDKNLYLCNLANSNSSTRIIDLQNRLVLPGFMDSHLHLYHWAVRKQLPDFSQAKSIRELLEGIEQYMRTQDANSPLVVLGTWHEEQFVEKSGPLQEDLDRVSFGIPLLCSRACGHIGLANTALLDALDWLSWYKKDASFVDLTAEGKPSGIIREDFYFHVLDSQTETPQETIVQHFSYALNQMAKYSIQDIASHDFTLAKASSFLEALEIVYKENPHLPNYFAQVGLTNSVEIPDFITLKKHYESHPKIQIAQIKLFKDGSLGGRTALLSRAYDDANTNGSDLITIEKLMDWFEQANYYKVPLAIHAIGDKATDDVVEAFCSTTHSNFLKTNPYRHSIIHAQIHDKDLIKKIKASNLFLITQPQFAISDWAMAWSRITDRRNESYQFKTLAKEGIIQGFSSDAPFESSRILDTIAACMEQPLIDQRFTFAETIPHVSETNQFIFSRESRSGKIEDGFEANLSILDTSNIDALDNPAFVKGLDIYLSFNRGKIMYKKEDIDA